ncbi:MAG: replicative DNA helicase [Eubacteriales bacterium]|jgi:replicative DNA helicase|nr:replicative DNA helicase [Bacillota bacterium]MBV1727559.1 replicative DNA helicase [Desulforudis sp.]MDP3050739.1 replicative DNA helicase [Eubacteriales bacterium]MDQ7790063.1 replicative DNA helicase [Clostridia bacterium]MBU4534137.1 replicative DNA helicase [Bacillota bacterium]
MLERIPPQNLDAEQAVLGALLMDQDAIFRVVSIIKPDDFYHSANRLIYKAALSLQDVGQPVDLVTVTDQLRREGLLEKAGGATYIASLSDLVPTTANVEQYARIVEEKALLRTLILVAGRIAEMSYEENDEAPRLLDQAEQMIMELSSRRGSTAFAQIREVLLKAWGAIEQAYANKGRLSGVPTGFVDLDNLCAGLQPSDLVIVAARPSMGKTALALSIAYQVAGSNDRTPVAVFSLEMSKEQLVQRLLSMEAKVDQYRLRTGNLREEDWERLHDAAANLSDLPIYIDDTAGASVREIRAKAKRLQGEKGLGLVIIDYIQLMQSGTRVENRQQEIAQISRTLKGLAKELNVPVVALSQLSRAVESRPNKRPQMSDLRESGSLEQDADVVVFIYREEYYNQETEEKGIAELVVAKQRNGPTGTVKLAFLKEFTRFVNLARH